MKFPKHWDYMRKLLFLQNQIIAHSIIYYELNDNVVEDGVYDSWCKTLVDMMTKNPNYVCDSEYHYVFCDFDGTTGCHIYSRLCPQHKESCGLLALHLLDLEEMRKANE